MCLIRNRRAVGAIGNQRGVTLIEAALVVGILALIIIAAMIALNAATSQRRATQAVTDIASIRSAVSRFAAGGPLTGFGSGSGTGYMKTAKDLTDWKQIAGFLPAPLESKATATSGKTLADANPWDGDYIFETKSAAPRQLDISVTSVPANLLTAIVKQVTTTGATDRSSATTNLKIYYNE